MTQNHKFLNILRERSVNSHESLRSTFIQMPRIIDDLEKEGYMIEHRPSDHRSTTYKLLSEPPQPEQPKYDFIGNIAVQR